MPFSSDPYFSARNFTVGVQNHGASAWIKTLYWPTFLKVINQLIIHLLQWMKSWSTSLKNEGRYSFLILASMVLWFSDNIFAKSAIVKMGAMLEAWKNVHDKRTYTLGNTTLQTEHCTTLHTAEYRKLRVTLSLKVVTATASKLGATTGKIGVWHRWNFQKPDYILCTLNNKVLSIMALI